MAAPACAAPTAASAISCGVIGRYGDIVGVWIEPVTAQVMMTFLVSAMVVLLVVGARILPKPISFPDRACDGAAQAGACCATPCASRAPWHRGRVPGRRQPFVRSRHSIPPALADWP